VTRLMTNTLGMKGRKYQEPLAHRDRHNKSGQFNNLIDFIAFQNTSQNNNIVHIKMCYLATISTCTR